MFSIIFIILRANKYQYIQVLYIMIYFLLFIWNLKENYIVYIFLFSGNIFKYIY